MSVPPLLLIAEGRRARPRKAPKIRAKEISLHKDVAKLLRAHCRGDWQWFHCPNGEARDTRTAAKLKAMGVRAGVPDLCLIPPTGQIHFLELKRPGETLSEAQERFRIWATTHGVPLAVCHDIRQVLAAFGAWGCLNDGAAALIGGRAP
jgi:hypothetical protein